MLYLPTAVGPPWGVVNVPVSVLLIRRCGSVLNFTGALYVSEGQSKKIEDGLLTGTLSLFPI